MSILDEFFLPYDTFRKDKFIKNLLIHRVFLEQYKLIWEVFLDFYTILYQLSKKSHLLKGVKNFNEALLLDILLLQFADSQHLCGY